MSGYLLLALAVLSYAVGIVAQTVAARRTEIRHRLDPGLLARLATDRVFLLGFSAQVGGFALAYFARATLPLYLVQAGTTAAVGVAAVGGVVLLGWRIRVAEMVVLAGMAVGLVLMVDGAQRSIAYDMSLSLVLVLVGILALTTALAVPAARLRGARGGVALGSLAGVAFAVLAVASRPVADQPLLSQLVSPPLWVLVAAAVIGQGLMTAGFQRGSTTATAAAMDATSTVLAAGVGLALLGDRIAEGHRSTVVSGLVLVVGAVVALALSRPGPPTGKTGVSDGPEGAGRRGDVGARAQVADDAPTLPAPRSAPSRLWRVDAEDPA